MKMLLEQGRLFEENEDYAGAFLSYNCAVHDSLQERKFALLIRLGLLQEAAQLPVIGPLSAKEAFRLISIGRLSLAGRAMEPPPGVCAELYLAAGRVLKALDVAIFRKELLLLAASLLKRAAAISALGPETLHELGAILSSPRLRPSMLETAANVESGLIPARIRDAALSISQRPRLDWRVMLNLARLAAIPDEASIDQAAEVCEEKQRWKVYLEASSMFSGAKMRQMLRKSEACAPKKSRVLVLLEAARREEIAGERELADAILRKVVLKILSKIILFLHALFFLGECRGGKIALEGLNKLKEKKNGVSFCFVLFCFVF